MQREGGVGGEATAEVKPCGSEALSWGGDQEGQKEAHGRGISQNNVTRTEGTLDF